MERIYRTAELRKVSRLRERRRKYVLVNSVIGVALLVSLGYGFSRIAASDSFRITDISISGASIVPVEGIKAAIVGQLAGSYFGLIPYANRFFVPRTQVANAVRSVSPRIKSVDAVVSEKVLTVTVVERTAHALWCQGEPPQGDLCALLDSDGFIFDTAPHMEGDTFLRWFGGLEVATSTAPVGGRVFADSAAFHDVEFVLNDIRSLGLAPAAVSFTQDGDIFVYLQGGSYIKVGPPVNYAHALSSLKALLLDTGLRFESILGGGTLEYIDVRFGNKAFYKLKM